MKEIEGHIRVSTKGVGYVDIEGTREETALIEPHLLNTALPGDKVRVKLYPQRQNRQTTGEVTTVVKRKRLELVGTLTKERDDYLVAPDDKRIYVDIRIPPEKIKGAKIGEKVLARIGEWPDPKERPTGEVLEVLGPAGSHETEMLAIVFERGFPPLFDPAVEAEAQKIKLDSVADLKEAARQRRDFRDVLTFTIDPEDAKDFDDAISFRRLADNRLEFGIHIADVAHYVKPDTALDREAQRRATSVYLVDRTIPMLPPILSNDLCSLNQGEEKLTFSAVFVYSPDGKLQNEWFGRTIILSRKRFTYEEAQKVLTAGQGQYREELAAVNQTAKRLRRERIKQGAIDFDQEEIKFTLDALKRPVRIWRKKRTEATMLVEELMLLANRRVAEFVSRIVGGQTKRFVYRIHDRPDAERIRNLAAMVAPLGHRLEVGPHGIPSAGLNQLLQAVAGRPEENIVKTVILKAMAKAVYSTNNIGHYGLAFAHYAHFTSPIRRYPDIMVHRLLDLYLRGERPETDLLRRYDELALHCSEREAQAQEAERESNKYKQVEYLSREIGTVFHGVISGITSWGIFVQEKETLAEGLVRLSLLNDDFYVLDEKNYALVGKRTGRRYRLGDRVRVKLIAANPEERTLDFTFLPSGSKVRG